jgi:hypothetical protein
VVYLQVKDALAATGEAVPAGQGDGQVRDTLAALRDSGFAGFMSLEPHLARAGRYGGFSGPEGFTLAVRSLKLILNELGIPGAERYPPQPGPAPAQPLRRPGRNGAVILCGVGSRG